MAVEGVETTDQAQILQDRWGTYIQAWLFSKPLAVYNVDSYLDKYTEQVN